MGNRKTIYVVLLGLSFAILLTGLLIRLIQEKDTPLYWIGLGCYVLALIAKPRKKK